LPRFAPWISIKGQVLDGPPGDVARRLSSFLLIPVGSNRQGFAFVDLRRLQETLFGDARDAPVGQQIEAPVSRLDHGEPHRLTAFDAGHLNRGLKARAGRRRRGNLQHRILESRKRRRNTTHSDQRSAAIMSDSRHYWNKGQAKPHAKKIAFKTGGGDKPKLDCLERASGGVADHAASVFVDLAAVDNFRDRNGLHAFSLRSEQLNRALGRM
jgi:hypothetical protein